MYKVCGCTLLLNDPTVCERCGAKGFAGAVGYADQSKNSGIPSLLGNGVLEQLNETGDVKNG
jgi:hypothetical protein